MYRYHAFYQQPSQSIQDLAYGDFTDQYQLQVAAGEALSPLTMQGFPQKCPALGQIQGGNWNTLGTVAPNNNSGLFADYLNLYEGGSWTRWTTSASHTAILQNPPYQVSGVGSGSTDFGTFQNGGL